MTPKLLILLSLMIPILALEGCSFYSSSGRKQFEEKAPVLIPSQGFLLMGCREFSTIKVRAAEIAGTEFLENLPGAEARGHATDQGQFEVQLHLSDSGQTCRYLLPSKASFYEHHAEFMAETLNQGQDLD